MDNELKEICNLLSGYDDKHFKVTKAETGEWLLTVKKMEAAHDKDN